MTSIIRPDQSEFKHYLFRIEGIVQGVGFRPFVYNLALRHNLQGTVKNTPNGVYLHLEGPESTIESFIDELENHPPPLARIVSITREEKSLSNYLSFSILESDHDLPKHTLVPPDASICADCAKEIADPKDRRYHYAFTNCTNCGPRYTIIKDIPYDRPMTTMAPFTMCPDCLAEYRNPSNRRFHAQPNACPVCGPEISVYSIYGNLIVDNWLDHFHHHIKCGAIFGIKSLGGFHLACSAESPGPVWELRIRKKRPSKPYAIMCRDLDTVRSFALVNSEEEALLTSPQAPIVLLGIRNRNNAIDSIAPGLSTIGVMLPYTPLHHLLFTDEIRMLVMTSGNQKNLPLTFDNRSAFAELIDLADFLIVHNRDIQNRCDDSVIRVFKDSPYFYRRSRGYSPLPITVPVSNSTPVLALGSDMKNTYCLLKGNQAFLGPHIGDLENKETLDYFVRSYEDMKVFVDVNPVLTAHDLHPTFMSSQVAIKANKTGETFPVQHHHAHLASCMADNQLNEPVLGAILDGTGFGSDRSIWGFEILHGDYCSFERLYHLKNIPIPGGEAAIHHTWRMACSYLWQYVEQSPQIGSELFKENADQISALFDIWRTRTNSPMTSSCGRFFDAVSAILSICTEATYEGQAAIELMEHAEHDYPYSPYSFEIEGLEISPEKTIRMLLEDIRQGIPSRIIAARFHHTVAEMVVQCLSRSRTRTLCNKVVLSGGVFQNELLLDILLDQLANHNFQVYYHHQVPTNDGGISLGQAVIAASQYNNSTLE